MQKFIVSFLVGVLNWVFGRIYARLSTYWAFQQKLREFEEENARLRAQLEKAQTDEEVWDAQTDIATKRK